MKKAKWSLRILTRVGDLAASLAIPSKTIPRGFPVYSRITLLHLDTPYCTTKGADCAISCFEISSFTLIITLYLPG